MTIGTASPGVPQLTRWFAASVPAAGSPSTSACSHGICGIFSLSSPRIV
jgi:hypothetical protein